MNNYSLNQAQQELEQLQNYQKQIAGEPVRIYPFKIVSGLNYLSNRGLKDIGTNPGNTTTNAVQETQTNIPYGAYSGIDLIYSGNKPIVAYWFGVVNATFNSDGTITETINATPDDNGNLVPNPFSNPLTAKSINTNTTGAAKWGDMETQYPWKEVGVIDFSNSTNTTRKETLDNVEVGVYETTYHYSVFSNDWYPSYQEINEFIYFIVDYRYPCPIALRIVSITPHFLPNGAFQWCDIELESVNQYFNTSSRNIMTYVKFGAPNDAYAFPQEIIENGIRKTIINPNFLFPTTGGVNSICVKNNSLVAQLATLLYGVPFTNFINDNGVISRTLGVERYIIPYEFEAPINDNIVNQHSLVHSSYSIAMNMVIISEQMWASWKQTKEIYNPIQNFTYQGGLAFAGTSNGEQPTENSVLYNSISSILNPDNTTFLQNQIFESLSPNANGWYSWGSCNLQTIIFSNRMNLPLDILQSETWQAFTTSESVSAASGIGFFLPNNSCTFDFRQQQLVWAIGETALESMGGVSAIFAANNIVSGIADIFKLGYSPNAYNTSEIGFLCALSNMSGSYLNPVNAWILNTMSLRRTHMLEVNYRDGIVYTNTNRGHGGFLNMVANWLSGVADKIIGYVPGDCEFFMNTAARTYNMFIPSSLLPLFQAYLDPSSSEYNAIPLDIFNNSYDNNTAVGQLQYLSGYQFSLTVSYVAQDGNIYDTSGWGRWTSQNMNTLNVSNQNFVSSTSGGVELTQDFYAPDNSFMFFQNPTYGGESYIITEANIKQLGQSNLHITYINNYQGKQNIVGEEWIANNAKVMKNNSYIENDFDYRVYDEYNTAFATNEKPFLDLQYGNTYISAKQLTEDIYTLPTGKDRGYFSPNASSAIKGIIVNNADKSFWQNPQYWTQQTYNDSVITQSEIETPYAFGTQSQVNGYNNPFGSWNVISPWNEFGPLSSSCINSFECSIPNYYYKSNFFSTTVNNSNWLSKANTASKKITSGYLNATEVVVNCLYSSISAGAWFTQIGGADLWGQMLFASQDVVYILHHLVFNISFLLTNVEWEYRLNNDYQNIPCLVPESFTDSDINNIVNNLTPNQYMDLAFVDKDSNVYTFSLGGNTVQFAFNAYGYNQNTTGSWDLSDFSNLGSNPTPYFYQMQAFFNGGGVLDIEAYNVDNIWTGASFSAGGGYTTSNASVYIVPWNGPTSSIPNTPNFKFQNNKYKIIMISINKNNKKG